MLSSLCDIVRGFDTRCEHGSSPEDVQRACLSKNEQKYRTVDSSGEKQYSAARAISLTPKCVFVIIFEYY